MPVHVHFGTIKGVGGIDNPRLETVRVREALATTETTTASLADGEACYVVNAEAGAYYVAWGSAPDASATSATTATTAGLVFPAGFSDFLSLKAGDKVDVVAVA